MATRSKFMAAAFAFTASTPRRAVRPASTGEGGSGAAAQQAALVLQELLARRTVTCYQRDIDRYGRFVGQCFVGAVDVNEWLVPQGLALAYRRYSRDYVAAEDQAREARFGMWAGTFEPPWEWRPRR
jgi:endonuclease YncB( thermonuclease family)